MRKCCSAMQGCSGDATSDAGGGDLTREWRACGGAASTSVFKFA